MNQCDNIINYHTYTFRTNVLFMCFSETDALMVWNSFYVGTLSVVPSTLGTHTKNPCVLHLSKWGCSFSMDIQYEAKEEDHLGRKI